MGITVTCAAATIVLGAMDVASGGDGADRSYNSAIADAIARPLPAINAQGGDKSGAWYAPAVVRFACHRTTLQSPPESHASRKLMAAVLLMCRGRADVLARGPWYTGKPAAAVGGAAYASTAGATSAMVAAPPATSKATTPAVPAASAAKNPAAKATGAAPAASAAKNPAAATAAAGRPGDAEWHALAWTGRNVIVAIDERGERTDVVVVDKCAHEVHCFSSAAPGDAGVVLRSIVAAGGSLPAGAVPELQKALTYNALATVRVSGEQPIQELAYLVASFVCVDQRSARRRRGGETASVHAAFWQECLRGMEAYGRATRAYDADPRPDVSKPART